MTSSTSRGMSRGGYYDANSAAQREAMDVFLPWLVEEMGGLPLPDPGGFPLSILDLGSSEGANAIHAVRQIVGALRKRTAEDIWAFFDDVPTNDFNRLEERFAADPARYEFHYISVGALLTRT